MITTVPGAMIVGAYAALGNTGDSPTTWTAPAGADTRANVNKATTRSGLGIEVPLAEPGVTPTYTATASTSQTYVLIHVLALRPAP